MSTGLVAFECSNLLSEVWKQSLATSELNAALLFAEAWFRDQPPCGMNYVDAISVRVRPSGHSKHTCYTVRRLDVVEARLERLERLERAKAKEPPGNSGAPSYIGAAAFGDTLIWKETGHWVTLGSTVQ